MGRRHRGHPGMGGLVIIAVFVAAVVCVAFVAVQRVVVIDGDLRLGAAQTQYGPLRWSDRDFLVKVRQAGLWEIPTGQQAAQRSLNSRVKEVGRKLAQDHIELDEQVRALAARLEVVLPSQASPDQQRWMAELSSKYGEDYDRTFAQRLRAAHGKVFAVVAQVRAGTRNSLIRSFAEHAVVVVARHMALLESTGYVDFFQLPEPVISAPRPPFGDVNRTAARPIRPINDARNT